ncbi:MAG: 4-(cytidine 5'-diphospho)-2-C-methyl-D-erythritol kinase, partial [Pseudomonadota bacterium]
MTHAETLAGGVEIARAKLNLCLHVTGQRPDGYHLLDSLVVFPDIGDRVEVELSETSSLTLTGPFGLAISAGEDNLVALAARLMGQGAAILLEKNLPVAAGLGGGSADAAAVLRILARLTGTGLPAHD